MLRILSIAPEPYELGKEAQKLFDKLNAGIAKYNADAARCDAERERIRSMPTTAMTAEDVRRSRELAEEDFDLKRQAHAILTRLKADWLPVRNGARLRHRDRTHIAEEQAFADLKAKLVKIGYDAETITRGTMIVHPDVRRAVDENSAAQQMGSFGLSGLEIDQQLMALDRELESAKRRLLSV